MSNFRWCLRPDLNRHEGWFSQDFKSCASTNSATQALVTCMRFELMTLWLKVKCSTNWANRSYYMAASVRFELTHVRVKVWCLTTWLRGKLKWWREMDSNHRTQWEQIYSLSRLASSLPLQKKWCRNQDLNPEPTDYKSVALPIELFRQTYINGGRYRTRTYDPLLVRQVL